MKIPEILEAFRINDGTYRRKHVDAAVELRDEITPHLVGILEGVLSDPDSYLRDEDRFDHIYAAILLGHFRESQAHGVIVHILSLPDDIPHQLFGDLITGSFPAILFRTCGGSLDRIKLLVLNKDAYDFCRGAALQAMVYAAIDGMVTREEVLDFFGSLFTGNEAEGDSAFWSLLANCVCDLYPEELMPVIQRAYQDGLIDSLSIGLADFERALQQDMEYAFEQVRGNMQRRMPANVHDYMSWWACFRSGSQRSTPSASAVTLSKRSKREKRKRRRKLAKASRRRNRR